MASRLTAACLTIRVCRLLGLKQVEDGTQSMTLSHDTVRSLGYDLIQPVRSESYEDEEVYRHIVDIPLVIMGALRP